MSHPDPMPRRDPTAGRNGDPGRRADGLAPPPGSAGFTMVEIMIAVIVSGIVGAGLFSLLLEQNSFYRTSQNTLAADINRRGVADLVSSELRMLATSDLYRTKGDSIRARFDVRRGVVCDATNPGAMVVLYFDVAETQIPGEPTGSAISSPWSDGFTYEDGWEPEVVSTGATPKSVCTTYDAPTTYSLDRYRVENWWGRPSGFGATDVGGVIRTYKDIVYTFAPSSSGEGMALWRNDVELAAPFAQGAGFTYIMDNGNRETSVGNANHKNIVRIRIEGTALGTGSGRYDVEQDLALEVPLRNRLE